MTKTADTSKTLLDTMGSLYSSMAAFAPVGNMMAQRSLEIQQGIADEVTGAAHRWLDRRHQGVTSLVGTVHQVMEKSLTDTSGAFGAMQDWYAGALERLTADLKSPYDLATAVGTHIVPSAPKSPEKPASSFRRAA